MATIPVVIEAEVQVQLEISAEGGGSLLDTVKTGAKGAITLTFSA